MPNYLCVTCGVQYAATDAPPVHCLICEDERQYVNVQGQTWTTLEDLRADHHNVLREIEPGLTGISTEPKVAIGQRALLVQAPGGNVLWDCTPLVEPATVEAVQALGGIAAIAISHPHFYSTMVEWSQAFGGAPIYLHASNRAWVMRPDPAINFWEGEAVTLGQGLTLIRCGGHFEGSAVLHWAAGAGGRGALFTSDTLFVVSDRRYVSFMYSYPNLIPLSTPAIQSIRKAVEPFRYDRLYGGWADSVIESGAEAAVARSATRYLRAIRA